MRSDKAASGPVERGTTPAALIAAITSARCANPRWSTEREARILTGALRTAARQQPRRQHARGRWKRATVLGLATLTGAALLAEQPVVPRGWQGVRQLMESPLEPAGRSRLLLGDGADAHIEHASELRVVHRDAARVRVIHTTGAASYRVEERGARELVIESPGFELRAFDAAFRVALTPQNISLDVTAGSLEWREGGASMRLTAGTRLRRESATPRLAR